jgi:Cdc6-like AAA superfamily ATPase
MGNKFDKKIDVMSAFSPSAPIDNKSLFAGRIGQITTILSVVVQRGQHAIIYGERGVGKTSLANVIHDFIAGRSRSIKVTKLNCNAGMTFSKLWKSVFKRLPTVQIQGTVGFRPSESESSVTLDAKITDQSGPEDIRDIFEQFTEPTIVIFDEIDRIQDQSTRAKLADTIKTLSDNSTQVTLILVGVGDSVDHLIQEHKSLERALVQIQLPRMSDNELFEIIDKALNCVDMRAGLSVKTRIAKLSQGLPHYTHLLGLHAAQNAVDQERDYLVLEDVHVAVTEAVTHAQQTIQGAYLRATRSSQNNLFQEVLLACALAERDDLGFFSAVDVRDPMSKIMKRPIQILQFARHLNSFCEEERGPVLHKIGEKRRQKFRFINPMLEPFVIMNGISQGRITAETPEESNQSAPLESASI